MWLIVFAELFVKVGSGTTIFLARPSCFSALNATIRKAKATVVNAFGWAEQEVFQIETAANGNQCCGGGDALISNRSFVFYFFSFRLSVFLFVFLLFCSWTLFWSTRWNPMMCFTFRRGGFTELIIEANTCTGEKRKKCCCGLLIPLQGMLVILSTFKRFSKIVSRLFFLISVHLTGITLPDGQNFIGRGG
jgi:hypothetical protein